MVRRGASTKSGFDNEATALERAGNQFWPDHSNQPIVTALRRKYLQRLAMVLSAAKIRRGVPEVVQELKQIGQWIFEPSDRVPRIRDPRAHVFAVEGGKVKVSTGPPHLSEILANAGVDPAMSMALTQALAEPLRARGRPLKSDIRTLAIQAVEARTEAQRKGQTLSWQRFANEHRCRQKSQAIRQAAIRLQRLLRKLGVAV